MTREQAENLKIGDKVHIHYIDIDYCGGCGDIITDGTVIYPMNNEMIWVAYKDEEVFQPREKEFYPHDLTITE